MSSYFDDVEGDDSSQDEDFVPTVNGIVLLIKFFLF